jgi:hypothetical protein
MDSMTQICTACVWAVWRNNAHCAQAHSVADDLIRSLYPAYILVAVIAVRHGCSVNKILAQNDDN